MNILDHIPIERDFHAKELADKLYPDKIGYRNGILVNFMTCKIVIALKKTKGIIRLKNGCFWMAKEFN